MVNTAAWQPRAGLALIPDGFEQLGAQVADGSHTASVELWSGPADGDPEWVYAGGTETRNHGSLLTSATARVQRLLSEAEQAAGEQDVTTRRYLLGLSLDLAEITLRARVKVVDSGDAQLNGRYLSVVDILGGSLRFERHLVCIDNLG